MRGRLLVAALLIVCGLALAASPAGRRVSGYVPAGSEQLQPPDAGIVTAEIQPGADGPPTDRDTVVYPNNAQWWSGMCYKYETSLTYGRDDGTSWNPWWGRYYSGTEYYTERAWCKFNLTPILRGAVLTAVTLHFYSLDIYLTGPQTTTIVGMSKLDPVPATAQALYDTIGTGPTYATLASVDTGQWTSTALNAAGLAYVQSMLDSGWCSLGWNTSRTSDEGDQSFAAHSQTNKPYLSITYSVHDVGVSKLIAPVGSVDSAATITPACSVYNYGDLTENYKVRLHIGSYQDSAVVSSHTAGTALYVTFANWTANVPRGTYAVACSTELGDAVPSNDAKHGSAVVQVKDVGITSIAVPAGSYPKDTAIRPKATWHNYGTQTATFEAWALLSDSTNSRVYSQKVDVASLAPGGNMEVGTFAPCTLKTPGTWSVRCSTFLTGDLVFPNDTLGRTFVVVAGAPPPPPPPPGAGWTAKTPMPSGAKAIKDGGWLAYDAGSAFIYASRGNKQSDFFAYAPLGDSWRALAPWLPGTEGKMPGKGSFGCAGGGIIYATKGNNTSGFWAYDIDLNVWTQKKDVPLGLSNKRVKGGTGMVFVKGPGHDTDYVYLLKGTKDEFYRYHTIADSWQTLTPAPAGSRPKWDKGSWLVEKKAPGPPPKPYTIYAHKAKYHEFYAYNTATDSWSPALQPMPMLGSAGNKKSKDGSCAALLGDSIFALKGGGTREFWRYSILDNAWAERETIPTGSFKKKVKAGAGIVEVGDALYATKGNKSNELWMYAPSAPAFQAPRHDGVAASPFIVHRSSFIVSPNPLARGFAVLRYNLPRAGAAEVSIYNVAGQTVASQTLGAGRSGVVNLDLRYLANGVYLVRFSSEGFTNSQKLIVQR